MISVWLASLYINKEERQGKVKEEWHATVEWIRKSILYSRSCETFASGVRACVCERVHACVHVCVCMCACVCVCA